MGELTDDKQDENPVSVPSGITFYIPTAIYDKGFVAFEYDIDSNTYALSIGDIEPGDVAMKKWGGLAWRNEDDSRWVYDETRHREATLHLVRGSALQAGISEEQFLNFLNHALNAGVVFRERC